MNNKKPDTIELLIKNILHGDSVELKDMRANELDTKSPIFQVYSFLEVELNRVENIQKFFTEKLNKIMKYPQMDKLIEEQQEYQEEIKILILEKVKPTGSIFNNKMRAMWNKAFNGNLKQ